MKIATCPDCATPLDPVAGPDAGTVVCRRCGRPFDIGTEPSQSRGDGTVAAGPGLDLTRADATADGDRDDATLSDRGPRGRQGPADLKDRPLGALGRFRLGVRLGKGSFGVVYRAYDPILDRDVALKRPRFGHDEPRAAERFAREARAAANLHHPNIVPVFESGHDGTSAYIASEFVEGQTLSARIGERRPDDRTAATWVRDLARAVAYAHGMGVIHRDIKPHNIMIDAADRPRLMDFGLAKRVAEDPSMTVEGHPLGTPAYMAPEQARGDLKAVGPHSDQYALGVVLYELLIGRRPFQASGSELLNRVIHEEPSPPRKFRPELSPDLAAICLRAMEKAPAGRYPSAAVLADDLDRWLRGEPTLARPISPLERGRRWCRRQPALASAFAAAALALTLAAGLGIGFAVFQSRTAAELRQRQRQTDAALAQNFLERGLVQCRLGEASSGLFTFAQGLGPAGRSGDAATERLLRLNLDGWSRSLAPLTAIIPHDGNVHAAAYSPDSKLLAIGGFDGNVEVLAAADGRPTGTRFRHRGLISSLAFSPDGSQLAAANYDGIARVYDLRSPGLSPEPLAHGEGIRIVRFSPDGRTVLTVANGKTARLWDAATARPIGPPMTHTFNLVVALFSPDGSRLLTAAGQSLRLWDARSGEPVGEPMSHGTDSITEAAITPDGTSAISVGTEGSLLRWNLATTQPSGAPLRTEAHSSIHHVTLAEFSPDAKTVALTGHDGTVRLSDPATGQLRVPPLVHQVQLARLQFSKDGRLLATAALDGFVRLWDVSTGQLTCPGLPHEEPRVCTLAFRPDGKALATSAHRPSARLWDLSPITAGSSELRNVEVAGFARGGNALLAATSDDVLHTWDPRTGRSLGPPLALKEFGRRAGFQGQCKALSPDGTAFLLQESRTDRSALPDPVVEVRFLVGDVRTGEPLGPVIVFEGEQPQPQLLAGGKRLLVCGLQSRSVSLWEVATGKRLGAEIDARCSTAALSPDGQALALAEPNATTSSRVRLFDAESGKPLGAEMSHPVGVDTLEFTPDGRTLITLTADGTVRQWDRSATVQRGPVFRHPQGARGLAISADGSMLATAGIDRTVRIWDLATGRPLGPPLPQPEIPGLPAFSPDGSLLLTPYNGGVRLWPLPRPAAGSSESWARELARLTAQNPDSWGNMRTLIADEWRRLSHQPGTPTAP